MPRVNVRDLAIAQHEAAHVVVGVALGLRLRKAVIGLTTLRNGGTLEGYCWFAGPPADRRSRDREALALMYGAGVAWEMAVNGPLYRRADDAQFCRELCNGRSGYTAIVRASAALLSALAGPHARVTRALLERDLRGQDIAALARGEEIAD